MSFSAVEQKLYNVAIRNLNVLKLQFAVIDRLGTKAGELEIAEKKAPKRYINGLDRARWEPYKPEILKKMGTMDIGDVAAFEIPKDDPDESGWRSLLCNLAKKSWGGKGGETYTTALTKDRTAVEVMRLN